MGISTNKPIILLLCLLFNPLLLLGQSDKTKDVDEDGNSMSEPVITGSAAVTSTNSLFQSDLFFTQELKLFDLEQLVETRLQMEEEAIYSKRFESSNTNVIDYSLKVILEGFEEPEGQIIDGKREGLWVFNSGSNVVKGYYRDDQMNGWWQYFYEKQKLRMEGEYKDDLLNGLWTYYYLEGGEKRIIKWNKGLMDGISKSYSSSGVLKEILNYDSGLLTGVCERYSDDGHKLEEGAYYGSMKHGAWSIYGDDGQKTKLETYKSGDLDGPFELYGSNGKLRVKGGYKSNKRSGEWVFYYKSGASAIIGSYLDGTKTGSWIYLGGELPYFRKGIYDAGYLVDDWTYFVE